MDPLTAENFDDLTPGRILETTEREFGVPLRNVVLPLPSYINRVYELETAAGERLIAKFYRPGRWSRGALLEEHLFTFDCAEMDVPVVAPMRFPDGGTLRATDDGIFFALFPKRGGRRLEIGGDGDWTRLGSVLGRLHAAGERRPSRFRLKMRPETTTATELERLLRSALVGPAVSREFEDAARSLFESISRHFRFEGAIRVHGDCHAGNILSRGDDGWLLIDFDDMMEAPPAQDIWLLLPGYAADCRREIELLLAGYRPFREFDGSDLVRQLEALRGMRMIYFLDWCGRQSEDYNFRDRFPGWGEDAFWRRESAALRAQSRRIET